MSRQRLMPLHYLEIGIPPFDLRLQYDLAQFHAHEMAAIESVRLQLIDHIRGGHGCQLSVKLPHGHVHA